MDHIRASNPADTSVMVLRLLMIGYRLAGVAANSGEPLNWDIKFTHAGRQYEPRRENADP